MMNFFIPTSMKSVAISTFANSSAKLPQYKALLYSYPMKKIQIEIRTTPNITAKYFAAVTIFFNFKNTSLLFTSTRKILSTTCPIKLSFCVDMDSICTSSPRFMLPANTLSPLFTVLASELLPPPINTFSSRIVFPANTIPSVGILCPLFTTVTFPFSRSRHESSPSIPFVNTVVFSGKIPFMPSMVSQHLFFKSFT